MFLKRPLGSKRDYCMISDGWDFHSYINKSTQWTVLCMYRHLISSHLVSSRIFRTYLFSSHFFFSFTLYFVLRSSLVSLFGSATNTVLLLFYSPSATTLSLQMPRSCLFDKASSAVRR